MPSRKLNPDIYYHVYNRGFNKQTIFFEERDFNRFGSALDRYLHDEKFQTIKILSYCLLPNHFHLLVIDEDKPGLLKPGIRISDFFKSVQLSYAMYFNMKYGDSIKKGLKLPIFEGRFQAKEVTDDDYLHHLRNYIEFNAVKHGIVESPKDWQYSSYDEKNTDKKFLKLEDFDPYFK